MATPSSFKPRNPDSKLGRVWQIADEITNRTGTCARRQDVINAYVAEGGNANTASTQFSHWHSAFKANRPTGTASEHPSPGRGDPTVAAEVWIGADGRMVIPQAIRRAMGIAGEGRARIEVDDDGVVTLTSREAAVLRLQRIVRERDRGQGSAVDELIGERRADAARDSRDTSRR